MTPRTAGRRLGAGRLLLRCAYVVVLICSVAVNVGLLRRPSVPPCIWLQAESDQKYNVGDLRREYRADDPRLSAGGVVAPVKFLGKVDSDGHAGFDFVFSMREEGVSLPSSLPWLSHGRNRIVYRRYWSRAPMVGGDGSHWEVFVRLPVLGAAGGQQD